MTNRQLTRDRLLDYDMPLNPHAARINMVYPWENISTNALVNQLYKIATGSGFSGSENDFKMNFGRYLQEKAVIYSNYESFPDTGEIDKLYFDLDEKILYYWDEAYIPINAMLIARTILDGGEA